MRGGMNKTGARRNVRRRILPWLVLAICVAAVFSSHPCWGETAILPVRFRNASDVLLMVKEMLSPEGRIAVDVQSNSLVVVDTPESLRNVQRFLDGLDKPVRQAKIRLRFNESGTSQRRSFGVDGSVSGEHWRVGTGRSRGDGVDVRAQDRRVDRQGRSEYFIVVSSGSWGYIAVGREVPYTQRWIDLCRRYARVVEGVVIQRIETGMEVRPVFMGNQADVEILPRLSYEVPGRDRGMVRFASAATRLSVPLGQWTDIGGAGSDTHEVMSAILESGSGSRQSSLGISFMVEAMN
ncbi:MAG: secretin N-terminal domain-containing protein [Thermodesulfobacteriota bacterium]